MKRILPLAILCALSVPLHAQINLGELSLEELMDIEVFTASRGDESLAQTAAAATVLTAEDLRRAGITSIPEALRLVPGMEVGRLASGRWAVTARGFNDPFANKLQVLVDGRSIYTPLFSGVFWDELPAAFDDIDRIEVVRGPGAALWGANAVNGIVNIITRPASKSDGQRWTLGAGTEERAVFSGSISGAVHDKTPYRVSVRARQRDGLASSDVEAIDGLGVLQADVRVDTRLTEGDSLTVAAGLHLSEMEQTWRLSLSPTESEPRIVMRDAPARVGHLRGQWTRTHVDNSETVLRASAEHVRRNEVVVNGRMSLLAADVHHTKSLWGQEWMAGVGYRWVTDDLDGSFVTRIIPEQRTYDQISAFAQSTWDVRPQSLRLVLGAKVESFDLGGVAFQPNVRLLFTPGDEHTLWASAARAVRTPSRADHDIRAARLAPPELVPENFPTTFIEERGDRGFKPETVTALEVGARGQVRSNLFVDIAAYHSLYDRLRTSEPRLPQTTQVGDFEYVVIPSVVANRMSATTQGLELSADWRPSSWTRLRAALTWRRMDIDLDDDSNYLGGLGWEGVSPERQAVLWLSADPASRLRADVIGRYVSELSYIDIDSYVSLDVRFAWQASPDLEVEVAAHDLLESQHTEFRAPQVPSSPLDPQRGVRLGLRWTSLP